jgi:hypothetical protein
VRKHAYLACFSLSSSCKDCNFHVSSKKLIHALTMLASALHKTTDLERSSSWVKDTAANKEHVKTGLPRSNLSKLNLTKEKANLCFQV